MKVHFGIVEKGNESYNYDEWSNAICGLKEESDYTLKMSNKIKFTTCKNCIEAYPNFLKSQKTNEFNHDNPPK